MSQHPYRLRLPTYVVQLVRKLHPAIKKKIKKALANLVENPELGKQLKQEYSGLRSYKVSRYRIIYKIAAKKVLEIIALGPRKTIYLETYRYLEKE